MPLCVCRGNKGTIFVLKKVDARVDSTAAFASQIDLRSPAATSLASDSSKVGLTAPAVKV